MEEFIDLLPKNKIKSVPIVEFDDLAKCQSWLFFAASGYDLGNFLLGCLGVLTVAAQFIPFEVVVWSNEIAADIFIPFYLDLNTTVFSR